MLARHFWSHYYIKYFIFFDWNKNLRKNLDATYTYWPFDMAKKRPTTCPKNSSTDRVRPQIGVEKSTWKGVLHSLVRACFCQVLLLRSKYNDFLLIRLTRPGPFLTIFRWIGPDRIFLLILWCRTVQTWTFLTFFHVNEGVPLNQLLKTAHQKSV